MKIYGNIMLNGEFFKGTIELRDGIIVDIKKKKENYDIRGTVIPTFINMHTHIGDFYYGEEPPVKIDDAVGPNGIKFRILKNKEKVKRGMRRAMKLMQNCGVSHFVDFREGGKEGIELLKESRGNLKIEPIVLGRGEVWDNSHGVGLSSISDVDYEKVKKIARETKRKNKIFSIHVSERIREDIDKILALNPDFIIHFLEASDEDIKKIARKKIPVVITPRANLLFGKFPDIPKLLNSGILLALGTDNGWFSLPSMFREMEITYKISRIHSPVSAMKILKMATTNPRKILKIKDNEIGKKARLLVLREFLTPYQIVNKSSCRDIKSVIL